MKKESSFLFNFLDYDIIPKLNGVRFSYQISGRKNNSGINLGQKKSINTNTRKITNSDANFIFNFFKYHWQLFRR